MSRNHPRFAEIAPDWEQQLSDEQWEELAGETILQRGQAYFEANHARLVRDGGGNASFKVKGSKRGGYDVELYFDDEQLHLHCTCPAADNGICKHMVAAGMLWRAHLGGENVEQKQPLPPMKSTPSATKLGVTDALLSTPAGKRRATVEAKRQALAEFLNSRSISELAAKLLEAANEDRHLMSQLKVWQAQQTATQAAPGKAQAKAWKEVITELLKKRSSLYHWKNLRPYIEGADQALELIKKLNQHDALQAREACIFAMRKLYAVAMHCDDSGGLLGGVMRDVQGLLCDSLRLQPPQGKEAAPFGHNLYKLIAEDPWGLWAEAEVLAAAGADVQAWAEKQAATDWLDLLQRMTRFTQEQVQSKQALEVRKAQPKKTAQERRAISLAETEHLERFERYSGEYGKLRSQRNLIRQRYRTALERQTDMQALYALLQQCIEPQTLAEASDWIALIEWCNAHQREREMLRWVQAALKVFPDDWRLKEMLLTCYERDGYDSEALEIRLNKLKTSPTAEHYALALQAAQRAGRDLTAFRAELFDWVQQREIHAMSQPMYRSYGPRADTRRDVSTRVAWLLHDKRVDEALALAETPDTVTELGLLQTLASKVQRQQASRAAKLLLRVFDAKMPGASTPYADELDLVRRITRLQPDLEARQWLAFLAATWRAKRNFITGLDIIRAAL